MHRDRKETRTMSDKARMALVCAALTTASATAAARETEELGTSAQEIKADKPSPPASTQPPAKPKAPQTDDRCKPGFVWREARPGDHVCVTPQTREDVARQNRSAKQRWVAGPYGPQTCIQGYVWREAFPGDKVCVTPAFREQTREDNRLALQRRIRE
jgi:hypothetical protein